MLFRWHGLPFEFEDPGFQLGHFERARHRLSARIPFRKRAVLRGEQTRLSFFQLSASSFKIDDGRRTARLFLIGQSKGVQSASNHHCRAPPPPP